MSSNSVNPPDNWDQAESVVSFEARSIKYEPLVRHAIDNQLLTSDEHVIDVFDTDEFDERIEDLLSAFPEPFITHALAVKAQPMAGILSHAVKRFPRLGLECASIQEAWLSHEVGCRNEAIVYDSPVKTDKELRLAMEHGFHINTDNLMEMEMIDGILKQVPSTSVIGLRINPIVGEGGIAASSTAGKGSKFGLIYCDETLDALVDMFKRYSWLQGLHCHVGSQGCTLDLIGNGAATIHRAAERINEAIGGEQRIKVLDIGGGVPTSYSSPSERVKFREYRDVIESKVPVFFSGKYRVISEFGRSVFAKYGATLTRVSAVKGSDESSTDLFDRYRAQCNQNPILLTHVGSNAFLREAYQMQTGMWRRRFTAFKSDGSRITGQEFVKQDIAGPMCFQGDYICKDVPLPKGIGHDDVLIVHDTGAYTYALYSRYNSRQPHSVYLVSRKDGQLQFKQIKMAETMEQTLDFWNCKQFKC